MSTDYLIPFLVNILLSLNLFNLPWESGLAKPLSVILSRSAQLTKINAPRFLIHKGKKCPLPPLSGLLQKLWPLSPVYYLSVQARPTHGHRPHIAKASYDWHPHTITNLLKTLWEFFNCLYVIVLCGYWGWILSWCQNTELHMMKHKIECNLKEIILPCKKVFENTKATVTAGRVPVSWDGPACPHGLGWSYSSSCRQSVGHSSVLSWLGWLAQGSTIHHTLRI